MDAERVVPPYLARPLRLSPFTALRLHPARVGGLGTSRSMARSPGETGALLRSWEQSGRLRRDPEPALYLHEYTASGLTIRGLVGGLHLDAPASTSSESAVLPHEAIHPPQVTDLADRMLQLDCQPAPILLVHRGTGALREHLTRLRRDTAATEQFTDRAGQFHRVWAIPAPADHARIARELAATSAVIADGHHRYAAYLRIHQEHPDLSAASQGLAMLVDQVDTPLFLGAIHRILHGIRLGDLASLPDTTVDHPPGPQEAMAALTADTLVATDGRDWLSIRLDRSDVAAVQVLQDDLVPVLRRRPTTIGYAHSVDAALRAIAGRRRVAVLVPAPSYDLVEHAARHGLLLPEKASSFQPKPSSGVFIRALHGG